jgi:outer membrane receptor protein involved in Fe transport
VHSSTNSDLRLADEQRVDGRRESPLGIVTVTSQLGDGRSGQSQLQFGGNSSLPRRVATRLFELSNELSWLLGTSHRVKVGALVNAGRVSVDGAGNQFGTYVYNSLADLDANRPALFARALNGTSQRAGTNSGALYVGNAWRASPSLQLVFGARLETTRLPGAPAANTAVEQAFGVRTNRWPTDVRVTPRFGFTYLLGNVAGIPAGTQRRCGVVSGHRAEWLGWRRGERQRHCRCAGTGGVHRGDDPRARLERAWQ